MTGEFPHRGFEGVLSQKPDPLWHKAMQICDELDNTHRRRRRGVKWSRQITPDLRAVMVEYAGYGKEDEFGYAPTYVYLIEAYETIRRGVKEVHEKIEGPYEDSSDEYWRTQHAHDSDREYIVDENYIHYTIKPDSPNPGAGDGYGGHLFRIVLFDDDQAMHLKENGFNVVDHSHEGEDWYLLTTRNLWQQGPIPPKHRHLFKPNGKIL